MKLIGLTLLLSATFVNTFSQTTSFKFDFGTDKAANSYIAITPNSIFSKEKGYGFEAGSAVEVIDRGGNALTGDYITSNKPFYFSVQLPDGNYDVKLVLGDAKGTSATTVRVENRRLMLENIRTGNGKQVTKIITVHVKDSIIRDAQQKETGKVRLKSREFGYRHWDNLLTLEFNDSLPKVCAVEITPNKKATTVFLAGNSTVVDQDREPWAAWGQMIPRFFEPGNVAIANYAESGETMKAFMHERRLEKIWSMAKPGDYLFIEFTHNDQKPGGNHLDPFTTYKQTIKEWIGEARKRGMTPVLVTSMHRRNFDSSGHIINTLGDYPEAMRQTAAEEKVALNDLNAMSKTLYEAWGVEGSLKAFVHYPANTFPNQETALADNTHFNPYGAYELARCIVKGIVAANLPIAKYLIKEKIAFDPAHPDPVAKFYWPLSAAVTAEKPDGN
ncbi:rhamnogalacturonan acetylesterase [Niastella koreensis]|uniref:G-D-S-L family lipolytic protein n=2 Tax=Niastella koreensis TaxID=354356 RepID=G8TPV8_NIAKG|nr:rhamnogalacturonan acetylesterase [Niastella koreensis]AEV99952.1 G-D-S-L family lipolytic protein [Niastella koreensis GR20-10]OQP51443.1 rhamnogalacturonan acetylesterase [Niastella koreensis]